MNTDLNRFRDAVVADPAVIDAIVEAECTLAEVTRRARRLGYDFSEGDLRDVVRAPGRSRLRDDADLIRANGWTVTFAAVIGPLWGIVSGPVINGVVTGPLVAATI